MASLRRRLSLILLGLVLVPLATGPAPSQTPARGHGAEAHDMELIGHDDLQGRSAYQPTIHQQRGRFIAYVGHHGGRAGNPLTGADEDNGTDRKSTRLNSRHQIPSYAVFCVEEKSVQAVVGAVANTKTPVVDMCVEAFVAV